MGAWGFKPWENDTAADWYSDLFDDTNLREHVIKTLNSSVEDEHEEIRAAAKILSDLGRIYIWPIDFLEDDVKLAISKLKQILNHEALDLPEEILEEIRSEIEVLSQSDILQNE